MMALLKGADVSSCTCYHAMYACVIRRVAVVSAISAARAGLTWSVVLVMVARWIIGGVEFHATSKGVELSCELDYVI